MKNSLIRKIRILVVSIVITSLLFFVVTTATNDFYYKQSILKDNSRITVNWTSSIDSRLNTLYEHLYDLSAFLYNNDEVTPGSAAMNFDDKRKVVDVINAKIRASSDFTALFIIDTESDMILYSKSSTLNSTINNYLKEYIREYAPDHHSSINNRSWTIIDVLGGNYYYKALKLGKFVIGAASDIGLYKIDLPYEEHEYRNTYTYIENEGVIYPINSGSDFIEYIDTDKNEGYYTRGYVVIPTKMQNVDATTYFINKTENVGTTWRIASIFMILDSALCVILTLILIYNTRKKISTPIKGLVEADRKLSGGDFEYKLNTEDAGSSEFEELYASFNDMSDKMKNLTIEQYDAEIKRQQNQLKMLRAQVKPHTFLNAINTINNMTYTGKPEDIRKYIAAFASFTRYMLYKAKDWTTVEEEIKNIDSYAKMQQIRFPESIDIIYDIDREIYSEQIPYLILFSLVQNSFKHAMTLEDKAYITISGEYYEEEGFKGFKLTEEDNGPGFSQEALDKIITAEADDPFTKEHLGLTNVRYSLNLIYKRDDLLRISNRKEGGAHIELLIPEQEREDETAGM